MDADLLLLQETRLDYKQQMGCSKACQAHGYEATFGHPLRAQKCLGDKYHRTQQGGVGTIAKRSLVTLPGGRKYGAAKE
eukprot:5476129-Pyramimonas_sp.AAC.1